MQGKGEAADLFHPHSISGDAFAGILNSYHYITFQGNMAMYQVWLYGKCSENTPFHHPASPPVPSENGKGSIEIS